MAELVLGVLGVVPLIGFTIKSYQELWSKAKTFRHCSAAVQRLHKKLTIQRRVFENECHLLLRVCIQDDGVVGAMMLDDNHQNWDNEELNNKFRMAFKQNYEELIELVHDISGSIFQIQDELDCFKVIQSHQQMDECLKKTWKRIGHGLKISFTKSNYEASLNELKESNCSLKTLREQLKQLQKPCKALVLKRPTPTAMAWTDIRRASETLHEALIQAWSCSEARHLRHSVKLFLDADKVDETVELGIAILCLGHGHSTGEIDLIQLQVKSRLLAVAHPRLLIPSLHSEHRRPKKRQKVVRFSGDATVGGSAQANDRCASQYEIDSSCDLRCSADICQDFSKRCGQRAYSTTTYCLGHIDVGDEENYRHQFFASADLRKALGPAPMCPNGLVPMNSILHRAMEDNLSALDRLKMAKALVLAVLRFHSTPWLGEAWQLQDLAFFQYSEDFTQSLQTIHVSVEFSSGKPPQIAGSSMEDVRLTSRSPLSQVSEDERLLYGIDNTTLHCLGVALLQIDRLQALAAEDVLKVRRLAKTSSSLGPKYKEITEKCLRCDFGYGTDLSNAKLQVAVHDSVIEALESMIKVLDIDD
ncbi:hypothetical protein S40288_03571 [Stachybotrys chartarum IBT 40288]|nr:hypothetical protein S40288_03571 [Stachybotrys chartarum IBT 40288]